MPAAASSSWPSSPCSPSGSSRCWRVLAGRSNGLELGLLRLLGGALCGLTLVVIASALTRLGLYADAYGFTATRLLAYAAVVWLGLVFVLVLVAGVRLRAAWLPRATVVAAADGGAHRAGAVNPEALMARACWPGWTRPSRSTTTTCRDCRPTRSTNSPAARVRAGPASGRLRDGPGRARALVRLEPRPRARPGRACSARGSGLSLAALRRRR